jgi:YbbR domain-containing protein
MKTILLNNWKIKLASLLLAFALWFLIKQNVSRNPVRFDALKSSTAQIQTPSSRLTK